MGIENENWLHFLMSLKDNLGRPEENLSKNAKQHLFNKNFSLILE